MPVRVKVTVQDRDRGFQKLAGELGGMGTVTLGVHGDDAAKPHPNSEWSIGELAYRHEVGLGVKERSWLRVWMDANEARMLAETKAAYLDVMAGRTTRKKAMAALGYKWVAELRQNIADGKVYPPLAPSTIARKGHSIPLLESATLANHITYKLFLKQIKSVQSKAERAVLRGQK